MESTSSWQPLRCQLIQSLRKMAESENTFCALQGLKHIHSGDLLQFAIEHGHLYSSLNYPLVNQHNYGKSPFSMGKTTINGHFAVTKTYKLHSSLSQRFIQDHFSWHREWPMCAVYVCLQVTCWKCQDKYLGNVWWDPANQSNYWPCATFQMSSKLQWIKTCWTDSLVQIQGTS